MRKLFLILFILIITFSCKKHDTSNDIPCDPAISYSATVKPIFAKNCALSGCHDGNTFPSAADYAVVHDASAQIINVVSTGAMPKNASLSDSDKAAIICWINNGSKNN